MTEPIRNLEVLVEEPSADAALRTLIPSIVPSAFFDIKVFRGKQDLLHVLPIRLRAYAKWLSTAHTGLVVLVDRDRDDCIKLKAQISSMVVESGLSVASLADPSGAVLPRIVVEELESWYLGDIPALRKAFPKLPISLGQKAKFRDPDDVQDTWRALERVLQQYGYHVSGLRKLALAHEVAPHMDVDNNSSRSFQVFRDGLRRLASEGTDVQAH